MYQAIEAVNNAPVGRVVATGKTMNDVINYWVAGKVLITFTAFTELKRMNKESLLKRRTTRAINILLKKAPLFFDEFLEREVKLIKSKYEKGILKWQ